MSCSSSVEMGRTKAEKLFDYVSRGEVFKVKSYLKKHRRDGQCHRYGDNLVNGKLAGRHHRQRTLLHLACASGDDAMVRVLMRHGARLDLQDSHGDTPLHLALERVLQGHKHAFSDLVLPMLEKMHSSPNVLDMANRRGRTPRDLMEEAELMNQERVKQAELEDEEKAESERIREEEAEWHSRLRDEWTEDMNGMWEESAWDDRDYTKNESFDNWADRIASEHREKQWSKEQQDHRPSRSNQTEAKKKKEDDRRKFQQKLEEEHERYQQRRSERLLKKLSRQKAEYLTRCEEFFDAKRAGPDQLGFDDIPWPGASRVAGSAEKMMEVLTCDVDRSDATGLRKYVRSQQLLWHPDKFLQKCGGRLLESDRSRIMASVTELSQALNQLGQEGQTT